MSDPNWLLSTLAQSTAAIVAIIGGFLVSRLVQLSSEKEGLRRRLADAEGELQHVERLYEDAHAYRLENSQAAFFDDVLEDLVKADEDLDLEELINNNIPRGSSRQEMSDYLDSLVDRINTAKAEFKKYMHQGDTVSIDLDDLRERGLTYPDSESEIYEQIGYMLQSVMPKRRVNMGLGGLSLPQFEPLVLPPITSPAVFSVDMRRLDESIREEQQLASRKTILETEVARLVAAIGQIGRPLGVTSAVWILGIYSVLGIVAPVVAMAFFPTAIDAWLTWTLVGMFTAGLALVIIYIYWYAKSLNADRDGTRAESTTKLEA